jgi:capsular exopolysaccharide synthesis family protein
MSRIQDILAKAERDGTTRQQAVPMPIAPVDGSSALDTASFRTPSLSAVATAVADAPEPQAAELRTATATLHPALVAALMPHSPIAEQYRAIRTRLAHREEHVPLRTLMITSPGQGDGKSVTSGNLALTMAQEIQRNIVLIDADLRSPAVHSLFGVVGTPGLAEVLAGTATLDEALIYLPDFRLTILPAGAAPQFPTELLGSNAMRRVIDALRARFDRLLLDVPAVTPLADVGTLAPLADGVVMVVRAGVTQRPALDEALAGFDQNQVVGIVLNETK